MMGTCIKNSWPCAWCILYISRFLLQVSVRHSHNAAYINLEARSSRMNIKQMNHSAFVWLLFWFNTATEGSVRVYQSTDVFIWNVDSSFHCAQRKKKQKKKTVFKRKKSQTSVQNGLFCKGGQLEEMRKHGALLNDDIFKCTWHSKRY